MLSPEKVHVSTKWTQHRERGGVGEATMNLRVMAHRSWGDDILVDLKVTVACKACNFKESEQVVGLPC